MCFTTTMRSPMPNSCESASIQATEPKAERVFIFQEEEVARYVFTGDIYVEALAKQTPRGLVQLLTDTARTVYPELKPMAIWRVVENTTPFRIPERATWNDMKKMLLGQESWSDARRPGTESVGETTITASIPVMGRLDLSGVKNPLIVFFRFMC